MNDLKTRLAAVMPPAIQALRSAGGPTNERIMNAHRGWRGFFGEYAGEIYAGLPADQKDEYLDSIADCLAVRAFQPGGVNFHGLHWHGRPEDEQ